MKRFGGLPRISNGRKQNCFNRQATAWIHYSLPDGKETTAHLKFPISTERCMHASVLNLGKVRAAGTAPLPCAGGAAKPPRIPKAASAPAQLPPEDKHLK